MTQPLLGTNSLNGEITISRLSAGAYSDFVITARSGNICPTRAAQEITLSEPGPPSSPVISGAGAYCAGSTIPSLNAIGSGIIEWYSDPALTNKIFSGSSFAPPITTGSATYYAIEISGGCKSAVATASFSIMPSPSIRPLSGTDGPARCNGTGYELTMNTELGVRYYLYKDGSQTGGAIEGVDQEQLLGIAVEEGHYTVKAESNNGACKADMLGALPVSPAMIPEVFAITGDVAGCEGTIETIELRLSGSQVGVEYTLSNTLITLAGTGAVLSFSMEPTVASNGAYTVEATDIKTGCSSEMIGAAIVRIESGLEQPKIEGSLVNCNKGSSQIKATEVSAGSMQTWQIFPAIAGSIDNTGMIA
ncbi:MAG TPA: hypothetical protein VF691_22390 [Cytophagaceae bacterium]|jgi:hypothetical protein